MSVLVFVESASQTSNQRADSVCVVAWADEVSGRVYYHNHASKISTWDLPHELEAADVAVSSNVGGGGEDVRVSGGGQPDSNGQTDSELSAYEVSGVPFSSSSSVRYESAAQPSLAPWAAMAMGYTELKPMELQPSENPVQEFCTHDGIR